VQDQSQRCGDLGRLLLLQRDEAEKPAPSSRLSRHDDSSTIEYRRQRLFEHRARFNADGAAFSPRRVGGAKACRGRRSAGTVRERRSAREVARLAGACARWGPVYSIESVIFVTGFWRQCTLDLEPAAPREAFHEPSHHRASRFCCSGCLCLGKSMPAKRKSSPVTWKPAPLVARSLRRPRGIRSSHCSRPEGRPESVQARVTRQGYPGHRVLYRAPIGRWQSAVRHDIPPASPSSPLSHSAFARQGRASAVFLRGAYRHGPACGRSRWSNRASSAARRRSNASAGKFARLPCRSSEHRSGLRRRAVRVNALSRDGIC